MTIEAYAGTYNAIVRIGDDVYEMSDDAHMPNGVCIYLGTWKEARSWPGLPQPLVPVSLSAGMARQVVRIALEMERIGGAS
jgi:hypothetical protein